MSLAGGQEKVDINSNITSAHLSFFPEPDKCFHLYVEGLGHTIDIIEVGDNLRGIVNGSVSKPGAAQALDIFLLHIRRGQS